ncbi:MAG TPA: prolyl oligopeptidase family serine peptidase, partial [Gemmatimonadales bacterium]|nr:prolyl oligopeptidase family serine peptidase [Gemmatimonadales bacterium]
MRRAILLLAGCLATPPMVLGQGRPLTLEDYYRLESAGSPAISPDGRWVAFTRSSIVESDNWRHSEVWLAATDGSAPPVRLTHPTFNSSSPRWSPDGRLLSFVSQRRLPGDAGSRRSVWFLRMDQPGEAFQIPGVDAAPVFSPDNQWIALSLPTPPPQRPEPASTEFERTLTKRFEGKIYDWMNYRFDGRGYLPDPRNPYATPPEELYLVPREGGTPRQLTLLGVNVQEVVWRPDSRALAVVADAHQRDESTYERADLWVVDVNGPVVRLTDDGFNHDAPAWTPDGQWLVFRRRAGLNQVIAAGQGHGAPVDLYRLRAAGGGMENLTAAWDLLPGSPTVSPDGRWVYFSAGVQGATHLFRVPLAGGEVQQVTRGERRLAGFTFSARFDHMAYTASDPTHPAEVYSARADGTAEQRLSRLNDAWLASTALRPAERLTFQSKDGTPVEGWLILPASGQDGGRVPMILSIHGGPHGDYGYDFSFQFQLWAAAGYAVLFTNPRGSTGYGEKFLWGTWGGWGLR